MNCEKGGFVTDVKDSVETTGGSCHNCCCRGDPLKRILIEFYNWIIRNREVEHYQLSDTLIRTTKFFYRPTIYRPSTALHGKDEEYRLKCKIHWESVQLFFEWLGGKYGYEVNLSEIRKILFEREGCHILEGVQFVQKIGYDIAGNVDLILSLAGLRKEIVETSVRRSWVQNQENCLTNGNCPNYWIKVQIVICQGKDQNKENSSWVDYRRHVAAQGITKLLKMCGSPVDENNFLSNDENSICNFLILIGKIVTGKADDCITSESQVHRDPDYVIKNEIGKIDAEVGSVSGLANDRMSYIIQSRETNKNTSTRSEDSVPAWVNSTHHLSKATIHYDLISKSLETNVRLGRLKLQKESHDALFIIYNYARILSILKKYQDRVDKLEYPTLSTEFDASRYSEIGVKKEEAHILQLLLEWPRILESGVNFSYLKVNLFMIPKFLLALAKAFNDFYFEINVLVPLTASHNFPTMMARIQLIQGIRNIFEDCMEIMQIGPAG